ncbi:hypothetical protein DSO57_1038513, partial [Entomophthora muscae]
EIVVPGLPSIATWENMKQILIKKFGGDLSLEVKKDSFMHMAFKPKRTLSEFADCFCEEGKFPIPQQTTDPPSMPGPPRAGTNPTTGAPRHIFSRATPPPLHTPILPDGPMRRFSPTGQGRWTTEARETEPGKRQQI